MGEEAKNSRQGAAAGAWLYGLILSMIVTFAGILAVSFAMSQLRFGSDTLGLLCILLEAAAAFAGAVFLGKHMASRRFLWGLLFGVIYFLILLLAGRILSGGWNPEALLRLAFCAGGGMLGGMLS